MRQANFSMRTIWRNFSGDYVWPLWQTVIFVACMLLSFFLYWQEDQARDVWVSQRDQAEKVLEELRQSSEDLTNLARKYVQTGELRYWQHYQEVLDIRDGRSRRPENYDNVYWELIQADGTRPSPYGRAIPLLDLLRNAGFSPQELQLLEKARQASDVLALREEQAMRLLQQAGHVDRQSALNLLFDEDYMRAKLRIMQPIAEVREMVQSRYRTVLQGVHTRATRWLWLSVLLVLLSGFALWWQFRNTLWLERQQRVADEHFRTLFEESPDAVLLFSQGRIEHANHAACQLLGAAGVAVLKGKTALDFSALVQPDGLPAETHISHLREQLQAAGGRRVEWRARRLDGTEFWAEVTTAKVLLHREPLVYMSVRDVSEAKAHTAELAELNLRLQVNATGLEQVGIGQAWIEVDTGRFLWVSERYAAIYGYSVAEMLRMRVPDVSSEEKFRAVNAQVVQNQVLHFEAPVRRKDGQAFFVAVNLFPRLDAAGLVTQMIAFTQDITARRQQSEEMAALNQSLLQQQQAMMAVGMGTARVALPGNILREVNSVYAEIFGYTPAEMCGMAVRDLFVDPLEFDRSREGVQRGEVVHYEYRVRCKTGQELYLEAHLYPRLGPEGVPQELFAFVRDVSTRRQTEESLRTARDFANTVLDATANVVVVLDVHGTIVQVNREVECSTGFARHALLGRPVWESLIPPEQQGAVRAVFDSLMSGREPKNRFENEWMCQDGSRRLFSWRNSVLHDAVGNISHVVALGQDVTEQRQREQVEHRRQQEQVVLYHLLQRVWCGDDAAQTLQACLEALMAVPWLALLPQGAIFVSEDEQLNRVASLNLPHDKPLFCEHLLKGQCLCGQVAEEGEARFASSLPLHADTHGLLNEGHYAAPLRAGEHVLGVLYLAASRPVTGENADFLHSVEGILASYLERQRLQWALELHNLQLEKSVAQRTQDLAQALEKLRDNERALEEVGIGIHWVDSRDGRLLWVNQAAAGLLGYTPEEMCQLAVPDIDANVTAELFNLMQADLRRSGMVQMEVQARHKHGQLIPCHLTCIHRDGRTPGEADRVIVFVQNISERVNLQERLQSKLREMDAILENSNLGIALVKQRCWGWVNRRMREMFGIQHSALGESRMLDIFATRQDLQEGLRLCGVVEQGGHVVAERQVRDPEGRQFWARLTASPVQIGSAEWGSIWTFEDVTEHREAAQLLQESLMFNRAILTQSPVAIGVYTADGTCLISNAALQALFGVASEDAGQLHLTSDSPVWPLLQHALDLPGVQRREFSWPDGTGRTRWLVALAQFLQYEVEVRVMIQFQDVTEAHEATDMMLAAKSLAERASESKSQFVANMSHEIRTPLNAILGLGYVLKNFDLPQEAQGLLNKMDQAGRSLLSIVNDVLDFSKIEAGYLTLEHIPFALQPVIQDVVDLQVESARRKGLQLRVEPLPLAGQMLLGDRLRLEQILLNLLSNAIKFTEAGEVVLAVAVQQEDAAAVQLRFSVRDHGIGIAPARQQEIFAAFAQADVSITRRFGGTGLGLAICRRLVALMEGEMGLNSQEGAGSEFWFSLSFSRSAAPLEALPPVVTVTALPLRGLHLLVVDDSEINREVAQRIFTAAGAEVCQVDSGQQALDCLRAVPQAFDLVLMDVQMPEMDGYEVTARIRAQPDLQGLPVVAMTAGAFRAQEQAALNAGMDGYIAKPIDVTSAIQLMLRLCGCKPAPVTAQAQLPAALRQILNTARGEADWQDAAVYRTYLHKFVQEFAAVPAHMAVADLPTQLRLLHKLKGSAGGLALEMLADVAAAQQVRVQQGETLVVEDLQDAMQQTLDAIAVYAPPVADESPSAAEGVAVECVRPLLQALMQALASDEPARMDPLLAQLQACLPASVLAGVREAVEQFDFRLAEQEVLRVARCYDMTLEK